MKTSIFKKIALGFLSIIKFIVDHILAISSFAIVMLLAIPVGFYGMYLYIEPELPTMSEIQEPVYKMPLQIYTADEYLIAEFGDKMSLPVEYSQIPKKMTQAFLAAEDDTFFEHEGISIKGLGRAITEIISDSGQQTGGSTITMQVAKNYFLSSERTFKRKLTELFLARRLEQNLSKEEILTLYVNKIYLGANAYGIKAAAKKYFSRSLNNLSTAQMAMLAGLPKAPSQNNPLTNPERAMQRRNWIVSRMLKLGFISQAEHDKAIEEEIGLEIYKTEVERSYPYIAETARYELVKQYGKSVMDSGWRVKLTVGTKRQNMADNALKSGLVAYGRRHGWHGPDKKLKGKNIKYFKEFDGNWPAKILKVNARSMEAELNDGRIVTVYWSGSRKYISPNRVGYFSSDARKVFEQDDVIRVRATNNAQTKWRVSFLPRVQGALAAVNPDSGAVEAIAGGYDFHLSKFNRATQGWRQPGSIIKPLVYTLAMEKGYRPGSMVSDDKLRVGSWKPKNSDGRYYGRITLRRALYLSRNLVSIRLLQSSGIAEARQFLSHFGLTKEKLPSNLTLALGTGQVLPLQMATAYATFANGGHRVQPYFIDSIYNLDGSLVYLANPARACAKCYNKKLGLLDDEKEEASEEKAESKKSSKKSKKKSKSSSKTKIRPYKSRIKKPTIDSDDPNAVDAGPEMDRLYEFTDIKLAAPQAPRIVSPRVAYDMASILHDVITKGTGKRARRTGRSDIGGKTGTTNMARDAWFAGFQPTLSAVVWVGYDTPRPLGRREYGGVAALPIWARFMRQALSGTPRQWVTRQNLSNSKKRGSKIVKAELPKDENGNPIEEEEKVDENDFSYKTSFQLPPTAYFIQRAKPKSRRLAGMTAGAAAGAVATGLAASKIKKKRDEKKDKRKSSSQRKEKEIKRKADKKKAAAKKRKEQRKADKKKAAAKKRKEQRKADKKKETAKKLKADMKKAESNPKAEEKKAKKDVYKPKKEFKFEQFDEKKPKKKKADKPKPKPKKEVQFEQYKPSSTEALIE